MAEELKRVSNTVTGVLSMGLVLRHFGVKIKDEDLLKDNPEKEANPSWDYLKNISRQNKLKCEIIHPTEDELREISIPAIAQMVDGS